jgi:4'-phosphopantetheinyl transferase EntD
MIALVSERQQLSQLAATDRTTCWDRLLFCAKEAIYKAWFPLAYRWLGFEDAAVTITLDTTDPPQGTFVAHLLVPGATGTGHPLTQLDGHWLRSDELVITATTLLPPVLRRPGGEVATIPAQD